jgi:hypothetical protein
MIVEPSYLRVKQYQKRCGLLNSEYGGITLLRNVGKYSKMRRYVLEDLTATPPWEGPVLT